MWRDSRFPRWIFLLIIAALGVFIAARSLPWQRPGKSSPVQQGKITLNPCRVPALNSIVRCGTYDVFEDRAAQRGRKITLRIVLVPALAAVPAPDPAFWFAGGPGAAATDDIGIVRSVLEGVRETRDIILVDQRGTGASNGLQCELGDDSDHLQSFFGELFPLDNVRACRHKLEPNANLKLYTTPIAMDDLDELRAAMGYDRINLIAGSYGTIAAQVYMRQHPEHVRAVFMLGVAGPGFKQPLPFAPGAQHALELLFADCAADPACHKNFPNLSEEFNAVLARFNNGPVETTLLQPVDKTRKPVSIFRANFVERIRLMLYSTGSARFLPFIIHRAYENDYLPFEAGAIRFTVGGALAWGMYLSVTCSEGVPFITEKDIVRDTQNTFVGPGRVRAHLAACKGWVRGDVPPGYTEFVKSNAPVLLVAGELDAASPPWFGEQVAAHLPHSKLLRIRYLGHQFDAACIPGLVTRFIENGSADGLDTTCTGRIRRPPFATELPRNLSFD
jgi:pimeloyl-ACP methyl ester carboxylesterase